MQVQPSMISLWPVGAEPIFLSLPLVGLEGQSMVPYLVVAAVVILLILLKRVVRRVTIYEFEKGLKYSRGNFKGTLGAGTHWLLAPLASIRKIDMRSTFASITGQEVLSADGVTLKMSLAAKYQVVDPALAVHSINDYQAAIYLELQLALRQLIGSTPIDELLKERHTFGPRVLQETRAKAEAMGLQLQLVEVKDVMFPGDLKKIFAQVVQARQEGLAGLERARAETAALRNLGNAARMLNRNPALMQLRLLQAMGESSGHTVVLQMPASIETTTSDDQNNMQPDVPEE